MTAASATSTASTAPLPKPGAVLFAKDLPALARFYAGVTQLVVVLTEPTLLVLESEHQQLVLHGIPARIAKTITITSPPKKRENSALKVIFPVASIAAAREAARGLGGQIDEKAFEARGFRACDGWDPEGNVLQLRERA